MRELTITLNEMDDIRNFHRTACSFLGYVDVIKGRFEIDAKSILGLLSLSLSEPVTVRLTTSVKEEEEEFMKVMEKYAYAK